MRKNLYLSIQTALSTIMSPLQGDEQSGGVEVFKHYDLWNQNVQFIEKDSPFECPACFVEFVPIQWETIGNRVQEATVSIKLHLVTQWFGQTAKNSPVQSDMIDYLDLPDKVLDKLQSLIIDKVGTLTRVESVINHNHEYYLDSVETYQLRVRDLSAEHDPVQVQRPTIKIVTHSVE